MKEAMCTGADGLIAIYPSRTDDPDRGFLLFHGTCLYTAGMCAQQPVGLLMNIERILHIPGGMIFGQVERCEIMPVILDLGAFRHGETQPPKDMNDLFAHESNGMMRTQGQDIP